MVRRFRVTANGGHDLWDEAMVRPLLLTIAVAFAAIFAHGCPSGGREKPAGGDAIVIEPTNSHDEAAETSQARQRMVRDQIEARAIEDPAVLAAMRAVPRHLFLPEAAREAAYEDHPVPIGHEQTMSQPFIVALMSELAEVEEGDRVLEVGTGSGYQAAILEEMGARVWSIEIVEPLAKGAAGLLAELGHDRVTVRHGDGYGGWPEEGPFDVIMLTAAPPQIPEPLLEQLAPGGRLVAPVGRHYQELVVVTAGLDGLQGRKILPVRFVPMTGRVLESPTP